MKTLVLASEGVVLSGGEDDFEELAGAVTAEANHEPDRRRRKRLDAAVDVLESALAQADRS